MRFKIVLLFVLLLSSPALAEPWKITITPGPSSARDDPWSDGNCGGFAAEQNVYLRSILARDAALSRDYSPRSTGYRRFTGVVIQQRFNR